VHDDATVREAREDHHAPVRAVQLLLDAPQIRRELRDRIVGLDGPSGVPDGHHQKVSRTFASSVDRRTTSQRVQQ
jgi:hypothetical protein